MQHPYKITRFGLIRHAQTVWNREKKVQGHRDSPLTADGERQASSWGLILSQFSWDRILASDTGRALTTGEKPIRGSGNRTGGNGQAKPSHRFKQS